ncbi:MAG: class I SAM-dependent methyltransferase [Planctomycetota bacterium]|jgi:2-polyprenyl-3-methyl-5-hydroxy-6-metoxy-1,4-benzoquinol methylase
MDSHDGAVWSGDYKIPWGDPGFSRRMLIAHLSQEHDLASRRVEWIDRQVAWIHSSLLRRQPARILDLGCGPGLYAHRLTALGHRCLGMDLGPASIEYAKQHSGRESRCEFVQGDIRHLSFGGPHDLVMALYGEANVFSPGELVGIIRKSHEALMPGGRVILELQTPEAVERTGRGHPDDRLHESCLFSDAPHRCRSDSRWLEEAKVAIQTFTITETGTGVVSAYRNTTKAWSEEEILQLLSGAGFDRVARHDAWPCNSDALELWVATRG